MRCGTCSISIPDVGALLKHWKETGCEWNRSVWERVVESKKHGHSGRRILSEAYPNLYKSEPMPEDVKEDLRRRGEEKREILKKIGRRKR
jgi:hypothetical protein